MPALNSERPTVVVVAGGDSAEREVSLASGSACFAALQAAGYDCQWLDFTGRGVESILATGAELAFLALHGEFGEDGQIQSRLAAVGIPFTGSDPRASHLAFHKLKAKLLFRHTGLATPAWRVAPFGGRPDVLNALALELGYPLFVKPARQGSSLGVARVEGESELFSAVETAWESDDICLLEQAIDGEEWTVALLDDAPFPPVRITVGDAEFYDYTAKYAGRETRYECFADVVSHPVARRCQSLGAAAYRALGCGGLARIDLRVDANGQPWLLEVNTLPGMTATSLCPKAAAAAGLTFPELCGRMVDLAWSEVHQSKPRVAA